MEFAIVGGAFLTLIAGVVEFCFLLFAQSLMQEAVLEGARIRKLGASEEEIQNRILTVTAPLLKADDVQFQTDPNGDLMIYTITYPWHINFPVIGMFTGSDTVTLSATGASG